ncbi:MAG: hypothetical protein AB7P09_00065 [Pyrinomonadaceae bacterium]
MRILEVYTDLHEPRLSGSPQLKVTEDWSVKKMLECGFDKAVMEPWSSSIPGGGPTSEGPDTSSNRLTANPDYVANLDRLE